MNTKLKIRICTLSKCINDFGQGRVQVPSFQRDFVWDKDKIKLLFDSIKNNYPIGSIQLWEPLEYKHKYVVKNALIGPYKKITADNGVKQPQYILDGLQRLSCLFGCLTNPERYDKSLFELDQAIFDEKFTLFYDLDKEEFIYLKNRQKNQLHQIPIYTLFDSVAFRQYVRMNFYQINNDKKVNLYTERADQLAYTLLNYQIPIIEIGNITLNEVITIIKRTDQTKIFKQNESII